MNPFTKYALELEDTTTFTKSSMPTILAITTMFELGESYSISSLSKDAEV